MFASLDICHLKKRFDLARPCLVIQNKHMKVNSWSNLNLPEALACPHPLLTTLGSSVSIVVAIINCFRLGMSTELLLMSAFINHLSSLFFPPINMSSKNYSGVSVLSLFETSLWYLEYRMHASIIQAPNLACVLFRGKRLIRDFPLIFNFFSRHQTVPNSQSFVIKSCITNIQAVS